MNVSRGSSSFRLMSILAVPACLILLSASTIPVRGADTVPTCADSDGDLNYEVKGFLEGLDFQGHPYQKYDSCLTGAYEGYLGENFCDGTKPWQKWYKCPYGCSDGACSLFPPGCTDADADRYAEEGGLCGPVDCDDTNASVNPGAEEACDNGLDDNCNGLTDQQESVCTGCEDSDGGLKYYRPGSVVDRVGNTFADACIDPAQLQEFSCSSTGEAQSSTYSCPNGCTGGSCTGPNIVVVGWDGTQKDHLSQCYYRELAECSNGLPNLAALSGGALYTSVTTNARTETKPGWTQLFTGYDASLTGVYDNFNYRPIPEGYTVFEKVEDHFGPENVVTMFLSGKNEHTGGACIGEPTYQNGQPTIETKGQPWCLTKNRLDHFENNLKENVNVGNRALALLEANQNELFFSLFIFWNPDSYGHLRGENSIQYSNAILDGDYWLGRIVSKLHELGIYENTLLYVISDHGFDEGTNAHWNAPFGILASNDPLVMRSGDRKDFAPTLLERYSIGLGSSGSIPAVDGYSLYSVAPLACIPQGGAYLDYPGTPTCCSGLTLISLAKTSGTTTCTAATGGTGNNSGYCTNCGNGKCELNENRCNCPSDCKY